MRSKHEHFEKDISTLYSLVTHSNTDKISTNTDTINLITKGLSLFLIYTNSHYLYNETYLKEQTIKFISFLENFKYKYGLIENIVEKLNSQPKLYTKNIRFEIDSLWEISFKDGRFSVSVLTDGNISMINNDEILIIYKRDEVPLKYMLLNKDDSNALENFLSFIKEFFDDKR
ncbi:hypothetical protein ADMFC3_11570 [Geovibrio sp. ADMFC3]